MFMYLFSDVLTSCLMSHCLTNTEQIRGNKNVSDSEILHSHSVFASWIITLDQQASYSLSLFCYLPSKLDETEDKIGS